MTLPAIAVLLALQDTAVAQEAPLRVEESAAGKDVLRVLRGVLRILPGGAVEAEFAAEGGTARRLAWRPGAAAGGAAAALEVWGRTPEDLERRFAVTVESEPAGGSGVADAEGRARVPVRVRWRRGVRLAVGPGGSAEECLVLRLVPREEDSGRRLLRAWVDPVTRRPRAVAVEEEGRRWVFVAGEWRVVPLPAEADAQADSKKEER
jgi:hypothetical protein